MGGAGGPAADTTTHGTTAAATGPSGAVAPGHGERLRRWAAAHGGMVVAFAGALMCAAGWYGVSGERYTGRQLPYLASATLPGSALIVAGAVIAAARWHRDSAARADADLRRRVAELHALLLEPAAGTTATTTPRAGPGVSAGTAEDGPSEDVPTADGSPLTGPPPAGASPDGLPDGPEATGAAGRVVVVPGGTRHHRPDCPLVAGKQVHAVGADRAGSTAPCPVCLPAAGG